MYLLSKKTNTKIHFCFYTSYFCFLLSETVLLFHTENTYSIQTKKWSGENGYKLNKVIIINISDKGLTVGSSSDVWEGLYSRPAVPNLFGTRDQFHGRQFFHGLGRGRLCGGNGFGMIQVHYIYCALYFYYYYIVIDNEIILQLTIMQNQWEPWACFPAAGRFPLRVMGEWWGVAVNRDEASSSFTSCFVAWYLSMAWQLGTPV